MGTGHRWNERQSSDHSVLIRPTRMACGRRYRDVSSSGLFVELAALRTTH